MEVCCECCVLSGRGLCDELITRPEESYRLWCVVVCDLETSWMRRPWPSGGCRAKNKQTKYFLFLRYFWLSGGTPVTTLTSLCCEYVQYRADKGWSCSMGFGQGLTSPHIEKSTLLRNVKQSLRIGLNCLSRRITRLGIWHEYGEKKRIQGLGGARSWW